MKKIFTTDVWKAFGEPDVGCRIYFKDKSTGTKKWYEVDTINYGHKRGIEMSLKRIK